MYENYNPNNFMRNHSPNRCNEKYPDKKVVFKIHKIDAETGENLQGAVFEILKCKTTPVDVDTTDSQGKIEFELLSSNKYILREIAPPEEYDLLTKCYQIYVDSYGNITVNGCATNTIVIKNYKKADTPYDPPTINPVTSTDLVVSGTGIPGAQVNLAFPDGDTDVAIVQTNSTWSCNIIGNIAPGDIIIAYHICSASKASEVVITTILAP